VSDFSCSAPPTYPNSQACYTYAHGGFVDVTLQRGHNGSGNTEFSSITAEYFHKFINVANPTIAFGYSSGPTVEISGGAASAFDGSGDTYDTWSWTHSNY
jgi:hypothetical protein